MITKDGKQVVIDDYFKGEKRAALASPDGALLTGKIVEALTGAEQHAQAAPGTSVGPVIGKVSKLTGSATAIRNGVSIELNVGDNVHKGDVVQAGANSSIGLVFIDGTVFALSANSRMVLNEMVYDPNGSSNSSLLSLVQGTISFVAGETAKRGDMKIDTPVATMGIRGTAVLVEIAFEIPGQGGTPPVRIHIVAEPGGVSGSLVLYSKSDPTLVIGYVDQTGTVTLVTAGGDVSVQPAPPLPPIAVAVIQQVLQEYYPSYAPTDPNPKSNTSPKGSTPSTPSMPPAVEAPKQPINLPIDVPTIVPITIASSSSPPQTIDVTITKHNNPPTIATIPQTMRSEPTTTADLTATVRVNFGDIDLTSSRHALAITAVAATGATQGLGLDAAALIALLTPAAASWNGGTGYFDLSFSAASTAFDYLSAGEVLTLAYTVSIDDNDGGVTTSNFAVTITGTNDAPVINSIVQPGLAEPTTTAALTTTIAVTFIDVDLADVGHTATVTAAVASGVTTGLALNAAGLIGLVTPGTVVKASGSSIGSVNLAFSAASTAFDYLSAGEVLALTYTLSIDDNDGGVTTKNFGVTITGTNDAPVIAAIAPQNLDEQTTTAALTTTIAVSFTDVDLTDIGHTATITAAVASGVTTGLALNTAALIGLVTPGTVIKPSGSSSGSVNLDFSAAYTAFDYLSTGEVLTLTYTVSIDDKDGGVTTKTFVITITGTNDAPVIDAIVPTDLDEQTTTAALTATIHVTFSEFTDVDLTDIGHFATITAVVATGVTTGLALNAAALIALVTPGTVIKPSGSSSGSVDLAFSADSTVFDYLSTGEVLTLTYTVDVDDTDGGITPRDFDIVITGTNDAPVIAAIAPNDLDEQTTTAALTTTVAVTFIDVDLTDVGHFATITAVTATGATTGLALNTAALIGLVTPGLVTKASGSSSGSVNLAFSTASTAFDYLSTGEVLTLTYTVSVDDQDGGVTTKNFDVTITGTNDAPVIAAIAPHDLDEQTTTAALTATVAVTFIDVDLTDVGHFATITAVTATGATTGLALDTAALIALVTPGLVTKASGSSSGSVNLDFSAASTVFDYLSTGEVLTLTYTVSVDDQDGGVTTKNFDVTITGTNDAPVIAAIAPHDLDEQTTTAALTTTVAVTFIDVDLTDVGHFATITAVTATGATTGLALNTAALIGLVTPGLVTKASGSSSGSVNLDFSAASTAFDYLSTGEVLTLTYTVSVDDQDGGVTTKDFGITITGTNDAPVIDSIAPTGLNEQTTTAALTATIAVTFDDVDLVDVGHTASITAVVTSGETAGLALSAAALIALVTPGVVTKASGSSNGAVNLDFSAASTAFDYLSTGEVLTLTYTVSVDDQDGGITTKNFVVTITGTNDAPVIDAIVQTDLIEQTTAAALTTTIPVTFDFTDVDLTDIGHAATVTAVVATGVTTGLALDDTALIALVTPGTVIKPAGSSSGSGDLDFSAASTAFDYLSTGEVLTLTYTVDVDDTDGGITPKDFAVTINGTNDAPAIDVIAPTDLNEQTTTAALTATVAVTFDDVDLTDVGHTANIAAVVASGETAGLALDDTALIALVSPGAVTKASGSADGAVDLAFSAASTAFDYLSAGEVLTLTYTVSIDDKDGGITTKDFVVTITGANDAPVIITNGGAATASISIEEGTTAVTTVGATDVDTEDLVYSLVIGQDSPDQDKFIVDPDTGVLSFVNAPDHETPASAAGSNVYTVQVQAADGTGGIDVQTIEVTVTDVDETLLAVNDTVFASEDTATTGLEAALKANDLGGASEIVSVANAKNGTVALNGGDPIFTPTPGFTGEASFEYWISNTSTPPGTLQVGADFAMGPSPFATALADLNGDEKLDLVVTNHVGNTVSVGLGNGDGTFQSATSFATGTLPFALAIGDLNGDGDPDIVTANLGDHSVSVLLGDGTGNFATPLTSGVNLHPEGVAIGDFNGDGNADVAVTSATSGGLSILLGAGNGTLASQTVSATPGLTVDVEAGDFNGDGKLDLVTTSYNVDLATIFFGDGNGGFSAATRSDISVGDYPVEIAVGDFNSDGKLDFVTANNASNSVSVVLGNGNGTFQPAVNYSSGLTPAGVVINDLDQDGKLDLIVTNGTDTISVLFGNGDGSFQASVEYTVGASPGRPETGDLNGDGRPDVVVTTGSNAVALLNTEPGGELSTAVVTVNVGAPDLNGDSITVIESGNNDGVTTVSGLLLADDDPDGELTVTATALNGTVSPDSIEDTVGGINDTFAAGITYTPNNYDEQAAVNDIVTVTVTDADGLSDALNFVFQQSGPGGATLTGTTGKDLIFGTDGNDTLTGLAGKDNFVFASGGQDTITDFTPGQDQIDLSAFVTTNDIDAWLMDHVTDVGIDDSLITIAANQTITLANVSFASLSGSDFIVQPGPVGN